MNTPNPFELEWPNGMDAESRVVTENDVRIVQVETELRPRIDNPYTVFDDGGRAIGSANLEFTGGAIHATLFLDAATPERLDIEVDARRVKVSFDGLIFRDGVVGGSIRLKRNG